MILKSFYKGKKKFNNPQFIAEKLASAMVAQVISGRHKTQRIV